MLGTFETYIQSQAANTIYQFKVKDIDGKEFDFASLKGKKIMVVNVASKCGNTPQYKKLEDLYLKYSSNNFVIVGFPANNFHEQEPGSNTDIKTFCTLTYGVTFPMMSKISVKGTDMAPIYQWLTQKKLNGINDFEVKWNFQKFLIDEQGALVKSIDPSIQPDTDEIVKWIEGK